EGFATRLATLLDRLAPALRIAHFRDPWGGVPIVERAGRTYLAVYEVNGLPSIELPFLYPGVPPAVLERVAELERRCLEGADLVISPSQVTAARLGVTAHVVRNGADVPSHPSPPPDGAPARYLLYFGALQPWQGVDTALRAFARLLDVEGLELVICASVHHRRAKQYRKLADKLELTDRARWLFALPDDELASWREHALASLPPP